MTRVLLGVIFLLFCLIPCAVAQRDTFSTDTTNLFTGKIGQRSVSIWLPTVLDHTPGVYEYEKAQRRGRLIFVADSSRNNRLFFSEQHDLSFSIENEPKWDCRYDDGQLTGQWYNGDRRLKLPISLHAEDSTGGFMFRVVSRDTIAWLQPEDTASPEYALRIHIPQALGTGATSHWINNKLAALMTLDSAGSIEESMNSWVNKNITAYRNSNQNWQMDAGRPTWNWISQITGDIGFNRYGYLILSNEGYQYSGGAHGSSWAIFKALDVQQKKQLALADILIVDTSALESLLEMHFRKAYDLKPEEALSDYLFDDKLLPNKNFYFSSEGLAFTYNQYEVAPYVMGIITIWIPWEELSPYLIPEFKYRMHLPN